MRRRDLTQFEQRQRDLPHWEEPGATYFVRFALQRPTTVDLTIPAVGQAIVDALRFGDGERYWLYDYTVMPDHVHAILTPITDEGRAEYLWRIMQNLKSFTARRINRLLGRSGAVWQDETYDHIIRNEADYRACAEYILQNAHAAGLIEDPTEWPFWGKGSGV